MPPALPVDGAGPCVSFIDDRTIEYAWDEPNPEFLPALAGASPVFIYRPAHYLKTVHADYADAAALARQARRSGLKPRGDAAEWAALLHAKDRMYRFDNIDLPILQPWRNTVRPPTDRYVAVRNPHFHRIDSAGVQIALYRPDRPVPCAGRPDPGEDGGRKGQPVDMPAVRRLSDPLAQWRRATTLDGRRNAWRGMLEIHADRVFSIGLVGAVPQPVVVSDRLRGIPVKARYGWTPFAYFGAYRPDLFWIEE